MIDTEVLRKKVIDLAIQGKLTEQLSKDGNAEDLYAQIQNEKTQLLKEGKIKKEKQLPEISDDEIPFEIPENWKWVRIGQIFTLQAGKNKTSSDIHSEVSSEYKYPCYGGNGLRGYVDEKNVTGKHILIGRQGALCGNINIADNEFWATEHAVVVYQYGNTVVDFYGYLLRALDLNKYATSVAQPGLAVSSILKVLIPLPPLEEQKRIAEIINEVISQINIIDELQQQYESDREILKGKIIDAGIRGRLTEQLPEDGNAEDLYAHIQKEKANLIKEGKIKKEKPLPEISDDEVPFEIPSNWKWVRFGDIARIYGGKRIPAGRSLTTEDTGHKYIRVSDMKNRTILIDNLLFVPEDIYPSISRYIINKEDIYITVAGTIGKVGKIPPEIDGANLTENADRIVFNSLDQNWLIWCLSASFIQKQIVKLTTQVAQPKLAITRIQDFIIPLPPLEEQRRIANDIDKLLQTIEC